MVIGFQRKRWKTRKNESANVCEWQKLNVTAENLGVLLGVVKDSQLRLRWHGQEPGSQIRGGVLDELANGSLVFGSKFMGLVWFGFGSHDYNDRENRWG